MALLKPGQAGTVESNDIFVIVSPAEPGTGITINLVSPVVQKYGKQIQSVIRDTLLQLGVNDVLVSANDKGALDCTIRARITTAVARSMLAEAVVTI